jgi:DNA-directed RNA polymerase specialized sigma24 family protein
MTSETVNRDEVLLERIRTGDQDALAEMFTRCAERLRRMVRLRLDRRLQGRIDASDVLQEAYLDISRRAVEYAARPELPFFLWLRMVTGQKLLEVHRRHLQTKMRDVGHEVSLYQGALPQAGDDERAADTVCGCKQQEAPTHHQRLAFCHTEHNQHPRSSHESHAWLAELAVSPDALIGIPILWWCYRRWRHGGEYPSHFLANRLS